MPILHSAEKRVRADRKRRVHNLEMKSELKTLTKQVRQLIQSGDGVKARQLFGTFIKHLDQAARKGRLHRKTASRTQSRVARPLHKLAAK